MARSKAGAVLVVASCVLGGCVASGPRELFSIPVTGQLANGVAASGQTTGYSDGRGTFWVQFPGGPRCGGDYSVGDRNPTLVVPVACSDGKKARRSSHDKLGSSGSAIVQLQDRTRGQFVFGDLTYSQTFGAGGVARSR